jgi:hypothetical protein
MTVSDFAPRSIRTFASTATSGLDGTSIIEFEEFVAQLLALGVAQLVAARSILGCHDGALSGLLDWLFLPSHGPHAATGLRVGQFSNASPPSSRSLAQTGGTRCSTSSPP